MLLARLASIRPGLEAEGVSHLALFGSRARQDNTETSDIDLLVEVMPASRFSLLDLIGVQHMVEDATGLNANAVMRRSLPPDFSRSIFSDVITVF